MSIFSPRSTTTPAPAAAIAAEAPTAQVTAEVSRLTQLEKQIALGLAHFHQCGLALVEIRDKKLFAPKWASFEEYLEQRWRISREHGHRLIQAAAVCANLRGLGALPANEAQARVLAKLEPSEQREVWQAAQASLPIGNVTAEKLEEVADKLVPNRVKKSRRKQPKKIVIKGKGWKVTLERRVAELDPVVCLHDAVGQLAAKVSTPTPVIKAA